jgi:superfamily I DNA/RNA helicase
MIDVVRQSPNIQIFTGDDDQAIMNFQGADVKAFLSATKEKEVLNQSYRIPHSVWEQAQQIVTRIDDRAPKEWHPKKEKGSIYYHNSLEEVPIESGEWTILASTNRLLDKYAMQLREEGWIYSRHDHPSVPRKLYEAILSWESLSNGQEITISQVRNIYDHMVANEGFKKGFGGRSRKFLEHPPESVFRMDYLRDNLGLLVDGSQRWHQVLGKVGLNTQNYLLNALRRGDNVKNPRIKLSTIHSMKGGENDNILLISDISYAASKEMITRPSTLHRMFYVGVTRTKENLHIMQPETERYYNL